MGWTTPSTQTTGTLITAAMWNANVTDNLTYLKANCVQAGTIAIFDAACPSGWTRFSALDAKFIRGNAAYGGTGGAATHTHVGDTHTHSIATHTHSFGEGALSYAAGGTAVVSNATEILTVSGGAGSTHGQVNGLAAAGASTSGGGGAGTSGATASIPPYVDVIFCKKD
jgi:hypothetical protein